MTLTDCCKLVQVDSITKKTKGVTIGETLQEVVWQALEQGRLTCGVQDCAHQMEIDPYNIMLCILPADLGSPRDVSTHINHKLIEAFCREYEIRLIKVDSLSKLAGVIKSGINEAPDNAVIANASSFSDISCLMLQYSNGKVSKEEEALAQHYQSCMFTDTSQTCLIVLPD